MGTPFSRGGGTLQLQGGPGGGSVWGPQDSTGVPRDPFQPWLGSLQFYKGCPRGKRVGIPQFLQGSPALAGFPPILQVSPRGKRVGAPQVLQGSPAVAGFPPIFHRGPRGRLLSCGEVLSNFEKVSVGEACGGPIDVCSKVLSHTALAQGGSCACVICPGSSQ